MIYCFSTSSLGEARKRGFPCWKIKERYGILARGSGTGEARKRRQSKTKQKQHQVQCIDTLLTFTALLTRLLVDFLSGLGSEPWKQLSLNFWLAGKEDQPIGAAGRAVSTTEGLPIVQAVCAGAANLEQVPVCHTWAVRMPISLPGERGVQRSGRTKTGVPTGRNAKMTRCSGPVGRTRVLRRSWMNNKRQAGPCRSLGIVSTWYCQYF